MPETVRLVPGVMLDAEACMLRVAFCRITCETVTDAVVEFAGLYCESPDHVE